MANLKILDGAGDLKYIKSDGAGTTGDPQINHFVVDELPNNIDSCVCGTVSASGDAQLVAAPAAGNRIVVNNFVMQNEGTVANTLILKNATTAEWRVLAQNQGDGLAMAFSRGNEWRLAEAAALSINLSAAVQAGYSIHYFTETV